MYVCDEKTIQKCLDRVVGFSGIENHIIRSNPKNPRYGVDLAERFRKEIFPQITSDVLESIRSKQLHGDLIDDSIVIRELSFRLNIELVRLGIAMIPSVGQ